MMARAYQNLTQSRLNGLALFAREGLDALAETVSVETGVQISERDDDVLRAQITEYITDTRVRDYTESDLWALARKYRLALEAIDIVDKRDARWKSKAKS